MFDSSQHAIAKLSIQQPCNEHFEMKFCHEDSARLGVLSQRNFLQVFQVNDSEKKSNTDSQARFF